MLYVCKIKSTNSVEEVLKIDMSINRYVGEETFVLMQNITFVRDRINEI